MLKLKELLAARDWTLPDGVEVELTVQVQNVPKTKPGMPHIHSGLVPTCTAIDYSPVFSKKKSRASFAGASSEVPSSRSGDV